MERRRMLLVVSLVVASLLAVSLAASFILLNTPASPIFPITVATYGSPVVGRELTIAVTVDTGPTHIRGQPVYLSLRQIGHFDILTPDTGDDPWGSPSVWNLTDLDWTSPRTFELHVVARFATEATIWAEAWVPKLTLADVRFHPDGSVDFFTARPLSRGSAALTTTWPFQTAIAYPGDLSVGNPTQVNVTIRGEHSVSPPPPLTYASISFYPPFELDSPDPGDDPWGLPYIWNLTGRETSAGVTFGLSATPTSPGNATLDAWVWSPRQGWDSVAFVEPGIPNATTVYDWGQELSRVTVRQGAPQLPTRSVPDSPAGDPESAADSPLNEVPIFRESRDALLTLPAVREPSRVRSTGPGSSPDDLTPEPAAGGTTSSPQHEPTSERARDWTAARNGRPAPTELTPGPSPTQGTITGPYWVTIRIAYADGTAKSQARLIVVAG